MTYFSDPLFIHQSYLSEVSLLSVHPVYSNSPVLNVLKVWDDYRGAGVTVSMALPIDRTHPELAANYSAAALALYDPMADIDYALYGTYLAGLVAADDNGELMVGVAPDAQIAAIQLGMEHYDIAVHGTGEMDTGLNWNPAGRNGLGTIHVSSPAIGRTQFWNFSEVSDIQGWSASESTLVGDRHNLSAMPQGFPLAPIYNGSGGYARGEMAMVSVGTFTSSFLPAAGEGEWTLVDGDWVYDTSGIGGVTGDTGYTWGLDLQGDAGLSGIGDTMGSYWEPLIEQQFGEIAGLNDGNVFVEGNGLGSPGILAGGIALILEANPNLGWRDVQHILAMTADQSHAYLIGASGVDSSLGPLSFIEGTVNGHGLYHNPGMGFGALDLFAAVRLAETWEKQQTDANEAHVAVESDQEALMGVRSAPMTGDDALGSYGDDFTLEKLTFTFTVTENIDIEHVYVDADFSFWHESWDRPSSIVGYGPWDFDPDVQSEVNDQRDYIEGISITLTAPTGQVAYLAYDSRGVIYEDFDIDGPIGLYDEVKSYGARSFWGMESTVGDGVWTVEITTPSKGGTITVNDLDLSFYGAAHTEDDDYVFNNALAYWQAQQGVATIDDALGRNTINAAGLEGAQALTAVAGGTGRWFDGTEWQDAYHLGTEAKIARLVASDGDDTLTAGAEGTRLQGERGNDTLTGGAGPDLMQGGAGADAIHLTGNTLYDGTMSAVNTGSGGAVGTGVRLRLDGLLRLEAVVEGGTEADAVILSAAGEAFFLHDSYSRFHGDAALSEDYRGQAGTARLSGVERIEALGGDDVIDLTSPDYSLAGTQIMIDAGTGNDVVWGSDADETILGGAGDDTLFAGSGVDEISGGSGADVFEFTRASTQVTLSDFDAGEGDVLRFYSAGGELFDPASLALTAAGFSLGYTDAASGAAGLVEVALAGPSQSLPDLAGALEFL